MDKEIHLSQVPFTPRGENRDFKSVKNYEFVRFDEQIKFRTTALMAPDNNDISDNEVDFDSLKTDEERVNAIVRSPMVEVRKRKSTSTIDGRNEKEVRFNPEREDLLETSQGILCNYQKNRRQTLQLLRRKSSVPREGTRRHSVSVSNLNSNKENKTEKDMLDKDLTLLVGAVDSSLMYVNNEKNRLMEYVNDWSHILEFETDIPSDDQGDIIAAIGNVRILLEKRLVSTYKLLESAEKYVNNNGEIMNEEDKHYRADDVFAFVDLLVKEIKKIDSDFKKLLDKRNNNWVEELAAPTVESSKNKNRKKKTANTKQVKGRIDIASLRNKFGQKGNKEANKSIEIQWPTEINSEEKKEVTSPQVSHQNVKETHKTPTSSLKKGVRSQSILRSSTGTPVHNDTPRPRKSIRTAVPEFVIPKTKNVLSKKSATKRSAIQTSIYNDDFTPPMPLTKVSRRASTKNI